MSALISFMAKLSPELLNECHCVMGTSAAPASGEDQLRCEVDLAAVTIAKVRAAEAALAPKKPGRPKGLRRKAEVQSNG